VWVATKCLFFHYTIFRNLRTAGFLKLNIKVWGRDQKLEAKTKGSRGQRLRFQGRGQNFGLEALTSLLSGAAQSAGIPTCSNSFITVGLLFVRRNRFLNSSSSKWNKSNKSFLGQNVVKIPKITETPFRKIAT